MKILLVEDDEEKRDEIIELLEINLFPIPEIISKMSFQSGKIALREEQFDLVLLDMDIPTYDISSNETGGRKQAFGGRMLLSEMIRRGIKTKVIVVTQFDYFENSIDGLNIKELDKQLKDSFSNIYYGYVQMIGGSIDWKDKLLKKINT